MRPKPFTPAVPPEVTEDARREATGSEIAGVDHVDVTADELAHWSETGEIAGRPWPPDSSS